MRKLLIIFVAITVLTLSANAQGIGGKSGVGGKGGFGGNYIIPPSFSQSTFVAETSATPVASITSPALILTAGQFAYVFCSDGDTGTNAITVTSSPANTFTQLTKQNQTATGLEQASYAFSVGAGSTTFTCTPATSQGYQSMIVEIWTPGSITTLDTQTGSAASVVASWTSPSFSTATSNGLIILCVRYGTKIQTFSPGPIGGVTATLRAVSASGGTGSAADAACEDLITTSPQTTITGNITMSGSTVYSLGTVGAFK